MAMAAQIETAQGSLTLVSVHYESESDAQGRADQSRRLVTCIEAKYGNGPCVVGGDLNTAALTGLSQGRVLNSPQEEEPLFEVFAAAGYDWRSVNAGGPTTRAAPGKLARYPLITLDWLFSRGVLGHSPRIIPALSLQGEYLSDHEVITALVEIR